METDFSFLHFLINESLYIVDTPNYQQNADNQSSITTKNIQAPVILSSDSSDKVLFLIMETDFFSPQERELLVKLVETTKIPFSQVQRYTTANYKPATIPYLHYFLVFTKQKPAFILGERYVVLEKDNKKMLWATTLDELLKDKQQKLQLWECMKKMFSIS